jgi:hypothetical protein
MYASVPMNKALKKWCVIFQPIICTIQQGYILRIYPICLSFILLRLHVHCLQYVCLTQREDNNYYYLTLQCVSTCLYLSFDFILHFTIYKLVVWSNMSLSAQNACYLSLLLRSWCMLISYFVTYINYRVSILVDEYESHL